MKRASAIMLALLLAGCGSNAFKGVDDKGSAEAGHLDTVQMLNNGDYKSILERDDAKAIDYSAAAMGISGMKPETVVDILKKGTSSKSKGRFATLQSLPLDAEYLKYLKKAERKIDEELGRLPEDEDLNLQMTLNSLTEIVIALVRVGNENLPGFDTRDGISSLEGESLANYISGSPDIKIDSDGDGKKDAVLIDLVSSKAKKILDTIPKSNFGRHPKVEEALKSITTGPESLDWDGNGKVTSSDISKYIREALAN